MSPNCVPHWLFDDVKAMLATGFSEECSFPTIPHNRKGEHVEFFKLT